MGATTLFHPVSLSTIRGAAINSGFRLGPIRQLAVDTHNNQAWYRSVILVSPTEFDELNQYQQVGYFNSCFAADIEVTWVGRNVNHELCVNFTTMAGGVRQIE